jgi:hypothetical protein
MTVTCTIITPHLGQIQVSVTTNISLNSCSLKKPVDEEKGGSREEL